MYLLHFQPPETGRLDNGDSSGLSLRISSVNTSVARIRFAGPSPQMRLLNSDPIYIREHKSDDFIISISKAVNLLGFRPRSLSEGLKLLCGFMQ